MSDTQTTDAAAESAGMSPADITFLISCLKNTTGGSISINVGKLAADLGYSNPKSASNRLATLRKKYNLPIAASNAKSNAEVSDDTTNGDVSNKALVTPKKRTPKPAAEKKAKVTKTPTKPRKGANVKVKPEQKVAKEDDIAGNEEENADDQEMSGVQTDGSSSLSETKNSN